MAGYRVEKRHCIQRLKICEERLSAEGYKKDLEEYKCCFHKFIERGNRQTEQVYKCDETGLLYRMIPNGAVKVYS